MNAFFRCFCSRVRRIFAEFWSVILFARGKVCEMKTLPVLFAAAAALCSARSVGEEGFAPGDRASGFVVRSTVDLPEIGGRMVRMEYERNGAQLVWLDRDDDNKTFSIAFRTLPYDDTGVAHIIEHSVLCGSAKYPVKEPFVELVKSSFATFLNAMTGPDITSYPVCSRNAKDFMNLVDVYMDAVLHPLSVTSPLAFRQEGWHYELDGPEGELRRNGVVFSEMKGAFAMPDRQIMCGLCRLLFPDTTYGFVSGGDPAAIPSLTFEKYKAFYDRFYHPSNARIFLDGKMDVRAMLAKLDGYLSPYARRDVDAAVQFQRPVKASSTVEYEIGADEKPEGKVIAATGWVCGRFDEREKVRALGVLCTVLANDNSSPLHKALVDAGLCEDIVLFCWPSAQTRVLFWAKGVKSENVEKVRRVLRETVSALAAGGLDRTRVRSVLDHEEFLCRERDSGSMPLGLVFCHEAYGVWNCDGDPSQAFMNDVVFASLRGKMESGYFENVLKECFVDNPHCAELTMTPSATLAAERIAAEKKELARIKGSWSREEMERVISECRALKRHQGEPDRPEDLAKLPRLSLSDIPEECPFVARDIVDAGGTTVIRPHTHANGILYAECYFGVEDLTEEELADLPMLTVLLDSLRTSRHSLDELRNIMYGRLGRFYVATQVYSAPDGTARPYVAVKTSALDSRADDVVDILKDVLLDTQFDDVETIGSLLRQERVGMEDAAKGIGGYSFASRRAAAQLTSRGAVVEIFDGIAQLRHFQRLDADFAANGPEYAKRFAALARKVFTRERLVVCLPDNIPLSFATRLAESFPRGARGVPREIRPFARAKEGFSTTGAIAGTSLVAHPAQSSYDGRAIVAARILTLDHLWDEIRVKGGAYGGRITVEVDGDVKWASWNDPKPARTLGVYAGCGKALRAFADGADSLDSYIVGAVAKTEPYLSPSAETTAAANLWLWGRTPADSQRLRSEMLRTTKDDLRAFADRLDAMAQSAATCVVGGEHPLESCTNDLDKVEMLAAPSTGKVEGR